MAVIANIHEAKTTLSKLIQRALDGEEVIIAKAGTPLVELKAISPEIGDREAVRQARRAMVGMFEGQMILSDDWEDSAFDAETHRKWYGEDPDAAARVAESSTRFKPE
jgi:antitoxin (DNA-binding transcriptional repressor) of toxin-antitoxin stability system